MKMTDFEKKIMELCEEDKEYKIIPLNDKIFAVMVGACDCFYFFKYYTEEAYSVNIKTK